MNSGRGDYARFQSAALFTAILQFEPNSPLREHQRRICKTNPIDLLASVTLKFANRTQSAVATQPPSTGYPPVLHLPQRRTHRIRRFQSPEPYQADPIRGLAGIDRCGCGGRDSRFTRCYAQYLHWSRSRDVCSVEALITPESKDRFALRCFCNSNPNATRAHLYSSGL